MLFTQSVIAFLHKFTPINPYKFSYASFSILMSPINAFNNDSSSSSSNNNNYNNNNNSRNHNHHSSSSSSSSSSNNNI